MSRPVKDRRTATTPKGPMAPSPKGKVGMPDQRSGRENTGAGSKPKIKADWDGPSYIVKQDC